MERDVHVSTLHAAELARQGYAAHWQSAGVTRDFLLTDARNAMLKLMAGLRAGSDHGQAKEHLIEQIGDRLRAKGIGEDEGAALADDLIMLILDNAIPRDSADCAREEDQEDPF